MSTAYLATRKVRHLAVWAADKIQARRHTTGHLAAICGQSTKDALLLSAEPVPDDYYQDPRDNLRDRQGHSRPICSRCLSTLDDLCYLDRGGR